MIKVAENKPVENAKGGTENYLVDTFQRKKLTKTFVFENYENTLLK